MAYSTHFQIPYQKIPMSAKYANDKQWFKDCINSIVPHGYGYDYEMENSERVLRNYKLYNNIIEQEDIDAECGLVTGSLAIDIGQTPKKLIPYTVVNRKIDKLIGEHGKRGFNPSVHLINPHDIKQRDSEIREIIRAGVKQRIDFAVFQQSPEYQQMTPEQQRKAEEDMITTASPDDIDNRRFLSSKQILGNQLLDLMKIQQRIPKKRREGFKHALLSDKEVLFVGQHKGRAYIDVLNSLRTGHMKSPEEDMIHKGLAAWYRVPMYIQDVLDTVGEFLSTDDYQELASRIQSTSGSYAQHSRDMRYSHNNSDNLLTQAISAGMRSPNDYETIGSNGSISGGNAYCWFTYCQWRGMREVGFHKFMNEYGDPETEVVDMTFEIPKDAAMVEYVNADAIVKQRYEWINEFNEPESIEYEWINRTYEGFRIDGDIFGKLRELPNQYTSKTNPYESYLTFFGTTFNETNAYSISYMDRMRPFQYLYLYIIDKIKELTAKEAGMISAYDTTQIDPELADKETGRDALQMQLYYESVHSNVYYNSLLNRYTGQQSVQRPPGFSTMPKSNASFVQFYQNLADWCEEQIGAAGAVSAHREGQTQERDGVRNVRQNVMANADMTEHYFQTDNELWHEATQAYLSLETKLLAAKLEDGEEHIVSYILPDESIGTLRVSKNDVEDCDLGIFVTDSSAERDFMQRLDGYTQMLITADKLLAEDIVNILEAMSLGKSIYQVKHMITASETKRHMRKLEEIEKQNEAAKQQQEGQMQLQAMIQENNLALIREKGNEERKTLQDKIDGELQKAAVVATGFAEEKDMNDNAIPDAVDFSNQYIAQNLKMQEQALKQKDIELKKEGLAIKAEDNKIKKERNKSSK